MTEGEFGPGNTGATGSAGGRRENDRYRHAWTAEDVDVWEGEPVPTGR